MKKEIIVLVGAGSIGLAIARRVGAGRHLVVADYSEANASRAVKTLEDAGFEAEATLCDLGSRTSIQALATLAQSRGTVRTLINAAGVSPSQAPVADIFRVDLYGTAVLLEEFGQIIGEGGSGVIISSQSGHRMGPLTQEQNDLLATTPTEQLLSLPCVRETTDTLRAYQLSKRCNVLRVQMEATRWGKRGATLNSISPGIIITPLAADELRGPRGEGYRRMLQASPAGRAGTPDEVAELAALLLDGRGRFISGADFLIDGGTTASYFYGDLQYLKATH